MDGEKVSPNSWVFRALMKVYTVLVLLRDESSVLHIAGADQLKALVSNVWLQTFLVFRSCYPNDLRVREGMYSSRSSCR